MQMRFLKKRCKEKSIERKNGRERVVKKGVISQRMNEKKRGGNSH